MSFSTYLFPILLMGFLSNTPVDLLPKNGLHDITSSETITVGDVIQSIKDNLTCEWDENTVDKIKTGSSENKVTGIATTFMATMEVIKKAKEDGLNLIITHEPTFYNHLDDMEPLKDDPVQIAKLKYINDAGITVFRFHDFWHKTRPDGINMGLINTLGWQDYGNSEEMVFDIPDQTVNELSSTLARLFGTSTVRVVGDPVMTLDKVGIVPGAWGSDKQIEWLNKPNVNALIVGESREWETIEYVRDMNELGMPMALIVMGHADSEDPGMEYCAEWMKGFIKEVPVEYIRAGNPLWTPE
jgi:putative NIF3 family GTP cyclohydrolase 1 type 2